MKRSQNQRESAEELLQRAQRAFEKGQRLAQCGKPRVAEAWLRRADELLEKAEAIVGEPVTYYGGWAGMPTMREPKVVERVKPPRQ